MQGLEPRNKGILQKLEKSQNWICPYNHCKKHGPANIQILSHCNPFQTSDLQNYERIMHVVLNYHKLGYSSHRKLKHPVFMKSTHMKFRRLKRIQDIITLPSGTEDWQWLPIFSAISPSFMLSPLIVGICNFYKYLMSRNLSTAFYDFHHILSFFN